LIRDEAALFHMWASLMGSDQFSRRSIWVVFLDDTGRTLPAILPIDDIPADADAQFAGNLASIARGIIADGAAESVAMLLSRPGPAAMQSGDRRWAAALVGALPPALRRWPVHLATVDRIQVFAADDLIAVAS
jgi:hypothetical protein